MILDFDSGRPIFIQIAEQIENAILAGVYSVGEQVPSTTEISILYKINPATALKGISILADEGILNKKRGVGMFVSEGARENILQKRKRGFYEDYVMPLVSEAKKLYVSNNVVIEMVRRGYENEPY